MLDPGTLPLPWPHDPAPEPTVRYVQFADGTLGRITVSDGLDPVLPDGVKFVTEEVYEALRAAMREQHGARVAAMFAAEKEARRTQYEDLVAAGIPEATARALSGHGGPLDDDPLTPGGGS
ncbi:hypothetical protein GTY54_34530 [Streptomyces sp. SID625]|nr:hypothetical protein [Streptomyces sp. SID625]